MESQLLGANPHPLKQASGWTDQTRRIPGKTGYMMLHSCERRRRALKVEITEREKAAIEQGLSRRGVSEVSVKIENGKIVVLQVEKKKII